MTKHNKFACRYHDDHSECVLKSCSYFYEFMRRHKSLSECDHVLHRTSFWLSLECKNLCRMSLFFFSELFSSCISFPLGMPEVLSSGIPSRADLAQTNFSQFRRVLVAHSNWPGERGIPYLRDTVTAWCQDSTISSNGLHRETDRASLTCSKLFFELCISQAQPGAAAGAAAAAAKDRMTLDRTFCI